jgi:hypothetical protein
MVGLGVEETGFNWRDVEFGFRLHQGLLKVYENGDEQYNAGPLVSGDQLTIRITGTTLQYRRNGELLYSRPLAGNEDFYIDTSFKDGQAEMLNYTVVPL